MATDAYRKDLAFIHDAGFGGVAEAAANYLTRELPRSGFNRGLLVDLGCGSGILAERLSRAGYSVLGIDISRDMIAIARKRAPGCRFLVESLLTATLPGCIAVTAVGESLNYLFDKRNSDRSRRQLFKRVFAALEPGGVFLFDILGPGCTPGGAYRSHSAGVDWAVLVTVTEDHDRNELTREITSFRKIGRSYRRDDEIHRVRLLDPLVVRSDLVEAGFRVRPLRGYGETPFRRGHTGFLARKGRQQVASRKQQVASSKSQAASSK
ncbi:MAG TPA: class I SAM-dependent methyltransferase [Blastocatellia bacterium]|nr:class I SAM-dependent methyltransferase [Blastocatellia bacterium]